MKKPDAPLRCRLDDGGICHGGYETCSHLCARVPQPFSRSVFFLSGNGLFMIDPAGNTHKVDSEGSTLHD